MNNNWDRAERSFEQARRQVEEAANEEQFQSVGLLCRETLISLAQAVFDPNRHPSTDGVVPSPTDAKRMLEAYLQFELQGQSHEAARRFARASLDLANDLQHRRTASYRDASLCVEATGAVVKVVALLSSRPATASIYRKMQALMPQLIAEMSADLKAHNLAREFYLARKNWVMHLPYPGLTYFYDDHEDLQNKILVLENHGLVLDVTQGKTKSYRWVEEFVEFLSNL